MATESSYLTFIGEIKSEIIQSRYAAARLVNREMLLLYFAVGRRLLEKLEQEKWGTSVLQQVSNDLQREMPGLRGFSYRNLRNMRQFAEEYRDLTPVMLSLVRSQISGNESNTIWQTVSAKLEAFVRQVFLGISFSHHILLMNRCGNVEERRFYMEMAAHNFWSYDLLDHQISARLYHRQGGLPNNFTDTLSDDQKEKALRVFKDEYLLDFMNVDPDDERVLEQSIIDNIRRFILTMGEGFAFIGSQYRLVVEDEEFFIDLLFFNRVLQCLVVVELKRGKFRPAHAGQLNFYLNVLDEYVRLAHENPSIGIVLCKEKNDAVVHFAIRRVESPIGVAKFQVSEQMPEALKKVLPDPEGLKRLLDGAE